MATGSKQYIVIPLWDHTKADEVDDLLRSLQDIGIDDSYYVQGKPPEQDPLHKLAKDCEIYIG
jgi:hypothetical protein